MPNARVTSKGGGAMECAGSVELTSEVPCFWNCHMAQEVVMCMRRHYHTGTVLQGHLSRVLENFQVQLSRL